MTLTIGEPCYNRGVVFVHLRLPTTSYDYLRLISTTIDCISTAENHVCMRAATSTHMLLRPPAFRAVKAPRGGWLLLAQREQHWAA